jgi:DNA-binding transcriptional MerR regulator
MELTSVVVLLVIAFALGYFTASQILLKTFHKILQDLGITPDQLDSLIKDPDTENTTAANTHTIDIRIEQVDQNLLAYQVKDDRFLAQAPDPDLLLSRIIEMFPAGSRINIDRQAGGELMIGALERARR